MNYVGLCDWIDNLVYTCIMYGLAIDNSIYTWIMYVVGYR